MCSEYAEHSLSPEKGVLVHSPDEGTEASERVTTLGVSGRLRRGSFPAPVDQGGPGSGPLQFDELCHHSENRPSQPHRAPETQPNWIQDPREPSSSQEVPRSEFPRLAWPGWGLGGEVGGSSWGARIWASRSWATWKAEGSWEVHFEHGSLEDPGR